MVEFLFGKPSGRTLPTARSRAMVSVLSGTLTGSMRSITQPDGLPLSLTTVFSMNYSRPVR
jgi:hypothetical protein